MNQPPYMSLVDEIPIVVLFEPEECGIPAMFYCGEWNDKPTTETSTREDMELVVAAKKGPGVVAAKEGPGVVAAKEGPGVVAAKKVDPPKPESVVVIDERESENVWKTSKTKRNVSSESGEPEISDPKKLFSTLRTKKNK